MPKFHLQRNGNRSHCRYSARPSNHVAVLPSNEFAKLPLSVRCCECQFRFARAASGESTDQANASQTA